MQIHKTGINTRNTDNIIRQSMLGFITCGLYNIKPTKDGNLQYIDMAYTCRNKNG